MSNPTEGTALVDFACEYAQAIAAGDAQEAITAARESGDEPIAWITSNNFMPPLRAFGHAEHVWQVSNDGTFGGVSVWDAYVEAFEHVLDENSVYLGMPEHDNALYVVDLARYEHVDEDERVPDDVDAVDSQPETLSDEWRPIEREAEFYADIKRAPGDIEYAVPLFPVTPDIVHAAYAAEIVVTSLRRQSFADPRVLKVYAKSELPGRAPVRED